jgi:hypothetical protein
MVFKSNGHCVRKWQDQCGVHVLIDPDGHLLVHADDGGELLVPVCACVCVCVCV